MKSVNAASAMPDVETTLPTRVLRTIQAQQDASERLVGWFQLGFVLFFGLLYLASPKTFSTANTFALVPWVLMTYLLFTVIRLGLAYRTRISGALLYLSVVIDVGLLLGMIWVFHIQYRQPPSFYLKVPTLLYVFIFIALRALRFEARYVIAAGLAAAAGWVAMAAYAINASGGAEAITRDYVYYLTSNSVLIGAEIDKITTILAVTAIIAVAIHRARRLLVQSVTEGTAARYLSRFFAPEIARKITSAEQEVAVGQGQIRKAAVLMVDIRGFTRLATRIEPDELICLLADYQSLLVPIIQRHSGTIDKFLGDGIMATFGAAVGSQTFAADALKAVEEIMAAADSWASELQAARRPPLRVGAAVAAGRIVFGAVGDDTRMEYTVIGDAVNLAAKLEKHTKTEGFRAICTASAFELARQQGYQPTVRLDRRFSRTIEGIENPMDLIVLSG